MTLGLGLADARPEQAGAAAQTVQTPTHARFDCLLRPFPADPISDRAACKAGCAGCMCWVCDVVMGECCDWEEHCVCDASPEWAAARHMARRGREAKRVKLDPDE